MVDVAGLIKDHLYAVPLSFALSPRDEPVIIIRDAADLHYICDATYWYAIPSPGNYRSLELHHYVNSGQFRLCVLRVKGDRKYNQLEMRRGTYGKMSPCITANFGHNMLHILHSYDVMGVGDLNYGQRYDIPENCVTIRFSASHVWRMDHSGNLTSARK